jgi:predicted Zn finger-like uncharacterized protein
VCGVFTICPKCALTLAVTAVDLRVGQGYVRCGRCSSVFNGLVSLRDDLRLEQPSPASSGAEPDEGPPAQPEPSIQGGRRGDPGDGDAARGTDSARPDSGAQAIQPVGEAEAIGTGTFETIVLQGSGISQTEEVVAEHEVDAELRAFATRLDLDLTEAGAEPPARSSTAPEPQPQSQPAGPAEPAEPAGAPAGTAPPGVPDTPVAAAPRRAARGPARRPGGRDRRRGANERHRAVASAAALPGTVHRQPVARAYTEFNAAGAEAVDKFVQSLEPDDTQTARLLQVQRIASIGSAALALALLGQITHHYRNDLASQDWFAASVGKFYAAIGRPLTPNWDPRSYEIRQLGAATPTRPGGPLLIHASLKNNASRSQPAPVVRLTLQDRYGNRLAARALEPREYLTPGSARTALAAGERVDTEIAVVDPGRNAVGFEMDTCVHGANGALRCASERTEP